MENLMHIGNKINGDSQKLLAKAIDEVLSSGFKNHTGEQAIIKALDVVEKAFAVTGVHVYNSTFTGK